LLVHGPTRETKCTSLYSDSVRSHVKENKCVILRHGMLGRATGSQVVKQEIAGLKAQTKLDGWRCLVCCDGWPSGALGISWVKKKSENIFVYCSLQRELLKATKEVLRDCTFISFKEAMAMWEEEKVLTVLQGSLKFCEDCFRYNLRFFCSRTIVIIPYCRFRRDEFKGRNIKWHKLKHQEVGGVSTSAWSVGVPKFLNTQEIKALAVANSFRRALKDIVKDGESGKVIECPKRNCLTDNIRLEQAGLLFNLPSFRSRTGWVRRHLSPLEIGWLYDMNELVIKEIGRNNDTLSFDKLLKGSIPGKITQLCHLFVIHTWGTSNSILNPNQSINRLLKCQLGLMVKEKRQKDVNLDLDPFLQKEADYLVEYGAKAAKDDDAPVPVELWDRSVLRHKFEWLEYSPRVKAALNTLRCKFAWRIYVQNLVRSFFAYIRRVYGINWLSLLYGNKRRKRDSSQTTNFESRKELLKDLVVGLDGIKRGLMSSWWEWTGGSTCFYWRWHASLHKEVRDGIKVHVETKLPQFRKAQKFGLSEDDMEKLKGKVQKVIDRGYLQPGFVASLINYFAVPKGTSDIRVVYDGTKSGLTEAVWAPNFFMPSLESLLMYTSASTWFSDMDLGEMFLNYAMDPCLRPYSGVDVSLVSKKGQGREWMQWGRTFMGFRSSPYMAVRTFNWCLDVVRGDPEDKCNSFGYDRIRINLPGDPKYNPSLPWLCKMNEDREACDVVEYMDDVRPFGEGEEAVRKAGKRASQVVQHLGQQSADRKYRPPSQEPGPWCGSFLRIYNGSVWVYVSKDKWLKGKAFIDRWLAELMDSENKDNTLDFKDLERGRGFLVYLGRSYPSIVPYLKGVHLTIDSWRKHRDTDGWKRKNGSADLGLDDGIGLRDTMEYIVEDLYEMDVRRFDDEDVCVVEGQEEHVKAPRRVRAVNRLRNDLEALASFFMDGEPPWRFVRGREICVAQYGFGDASGTGFGSTYMTPEGIKYRFGSWGSDTSEESSNYRELSNLVDSLVERLEENMNNLIGIEVFLFTDNLVAESAFFKGTSSSKSLFELILKLRQLELSGGFKVHVIHIAGSRMIAQGTDGLSRGDIGEGVMSGQSMLEFVPINKSCLDRSPLLRDWILSWLMPLSKACHHDITFLSIKDWFHFGHDIVGGQSNPENLWLPIYKSGIHVWTPPPAAGQHCIEQLRKARLKRTTSTHVVVVPRIFTSLWRKQLYRVSDVVVELPFNDGVWAQRFQHEPLTLAFVFPFLEYKPWQLKRSYSFLGMGRMLRKLWKDGEIPLWVVLHKFCKWASRLYTLSPGMVRKMLQSSRDFELFCREASE